MKILYRILATAGGIGHLPLAPGTWASVATAISWYFVKSNSSISLQTELLVNFLIILIGILASSAMIKDWGKDPSQVVIDEVSGMSLALISIPAKPLWFVIALVLFRFFDIVKPLGIKKAEEAKGGWGIMLDDILAGVYSLLLIKLVILFLPIG